MLNNVTASILNQEKIICDYNAFLVHNMDNDEETLYVLVGFAEHDVFYQVIYNDGNFGTLWIKDTEDFNERFGENYIVYYVNRASIKFNSVDYKVE